MFETIFTIWLVLVVLSGLVKAASNRRKRQAILDHQYRQIQSPRKDSNDDAA